MRTFERWIGMAVLALSCAVPAARAQQPLGARPTAEGVLVDFQDADIRVVITALAEAAGLNVVFGELPTRRITLRVRQAVPVEEVRSLLRTIAESNGLRVSERTGLMQFEAVPAAPPPATRATGSETKLFVYQLKHARATRLAATLQAIFSGGVTAVSDASPSLPLSRQLRAQQLAPIDPDTLGRRPRGEPVLPVATPRPAGGDIQIVADENTNALLVRASDADWEVIRQAIEGVDLRPLQVLIEVMIVEVRRSHDLDLSVSGKASKNEAGFPDPRRQAELKGENTGDLLLKWANGGGIDVSVALSALARRGDVRILSRPVLLAQNNQEARILVGSQRPFVQVFRSLPTDAGVRDQIVQYREVGTSLTIVPTVNADGYVNLQLSQEVSSATNETQFGAPVISTREASTYLFVRDGQTTVIGGLVDRQSEKSRSGVPFLIDIPLLGALFGTTRVNTSNAELFLFLTPHVVQTDEDLDRLREGLERRLDLVRKELEKVKPIAPTDSARKLLRGSSGTP